MFRKMEKFKKDLTKWIFKKSPLVFNSSMGVRGREHVTYKSKFYREFSYRKKCHMQAMNEFDLIRHIFRPSILNNSA